VEFNYCFTIPDLYSDSLLSSQGHKTDALQQVINPPFSSDNSNKDSKGFFYCYVSFKQAVSVSTTRDTFSNNNYRSTSAQQRALVLISRYPIPNLAYTILATIESTLFHVLNPDPKAVANKPEMTQDISKAFDVSLEQIHQNWAPMVLSRGDSEEMSAGGHGLSWYAGIALPFFGDVRTPHTHTSLSDPLSFFPLLPLSTVDPPVHSVHPPLHWGSHHLSRLYQSECLPSSGLHSHVPRGCGDLLQWIQSHRSVWTLRPHPSPLGSLGIPPPRMRCRGHWSNS
jgi:hypothetical protein